MKKVLLFGMAEAREKTLEALRDLGVMQVELSGKWSSDSQGAEEKLDSLSRLLGDYARLTRPREKTEPSMAAGRPRLSGAAAAERISGLLERRTALNAELDTVRSRLKTLAVWGNFDRKLLDRLNASGMRVIPCVGTAAEYAAACGTPGLCCELLRDACPVYIFAVVSAGVVDESKLPVFKLTPADDPGELRGREQRLGADVRRTEAELYDLEPELESIGRYRDELAAKLEFSRVADAVGDHAEIVSLSGFVPVPELESLRARAKAEGWGLYVCDPEPDERVPVLVRRGNFYTKTVKPLFDFLGIVPGYRELDASGGIFFFFTIFYAIIVGDAGYGLLFLAGSAFLAWKFRRDRSKRPLVRLAFTLSLATVAWGALCGAWFGVQKGGIRLLTDPAVKDANTQTFCFILAVAQLSLGHAWRAINERSWKSLMSNLGWTLIIWGNFFLALKIIVTPGDFPTCMYYLYGAGLFLVLAFSVRWTDPAAVFQFPFDVIGSFTDVLSYIRLFAVGMAGACIAATFNDMSLDVAGSSPYFIVFGILGLLVGHGLNLALCVMGVLVHAVRLNTLEFSNHSGLTWSGTEFKPFAKHNNTNQEE